MPFSSLTAIDLIPENSLATPGLFNHIFSQLSDNIGTINAGGTPTDTLSASTWASIGLTANSNRSDYLRLKDSAGQRSTYRIGSAAGGTADGLNIFDESGNTMIASFSKQSIRFYQNVVGPVFDTGGALTSTLNAATLGSGTDSNESRIQAAIIQAAQQGLARVYVPANMYPYSASSVSFIYSVQMVREGEDFIYYDGQAYGASGLGSLNDTRALQQQLNAAGAKLSQVPPGTYQVAALSTLSRSKVLGAQALMRPSSNSTTVILLAPGLGPADADYQLVRDMRIDGTGKSGITGLRANINSGEFLASLTLENITAYNCDTCAFDLQNAQFIRTYNLAASTGSGVGMLIKNAVTDGGGNSQDHFGLQLAYKDIGLVVNGTNFATGCLDLNFYSPQILVNAICGMAFFSCKATVHGGAPELNGTGASSMTVDGLNVKRASFYMNNADVRVENCHQGETGTCDPQYLLENNSILQIRNGGFNGHTSSTALLVSADSTSRVILDGTFAGQATVQNVAGWPSSLYLPATAQVCLFGEPVHAVDTTIAPLFAEQATAWANGITSAPSSNAFAEDANLGYCRSVTFQAVAGDGPTQVGCVKNTFASVPANMDTLFTWLWKSDKDCTMFVEMHDGTNFYAVGVSTIKLYANKVTKVVLGKRNIPSGNWLFTWGPFDTTAPNVKMSNFQLYQGATGTGGTTKDIAKIVSTGAFWPGVTRETQTNLRDKTQSVNSLGKYPGKQVYDVTNNRPVWANGQATTDVWEDGANTTVHTPV